MSAIGAHSSFRAGPFRRRVALFEKVLVIDAAEHLAAGQVVDLDHRQRPAQLFERRLDDRGEFAVRDQQLGFAMREDKSDRTRVETIVQRIQHCACHWHAVMRLE